MDKKWEKIEIVPTWNFEEDNEFVGFFVDMETKVGPNESNLYNFRKYNGERIAVWGNTILDNRFKSVGAGDEVKIIYKGKATSPKTGREYHNFEVFKVAKEDIPVKEEDIPIVEDAI